MLRYKVLAGIGGRGVARGGEMHSKGLMASAFALAVLFLMAMATPSGAASISCSEGQTLAGGEIKGDVTVGENRTCALFGVTVDGDVTVEPGAFLQMSGGRNGFGPTTVKGDVTVGRGGRLFARAAAFDEPSETLVRGSVRGNGAAEVIFDGENTIDGNFALTGTGETENFLFGEVFVSGGRVNGNIEIDNGQPAIEIKNETIGGSLHILNNLSPVPTGEGTGQAFVEIGASTVGKNVEIAHNGLAAPLLNVLSIRNTSVANQLLVYNNTETATSELPGLGRNEIILSSNHVSGNAELLNNTNKTTGGGVGPGRTEVSANMVTNTLNCLGNVPPPLGKENTAKHRLGQCEAL